MKINPDKLRKLVLDMVYDRKSGHIGGSFSIAELIAYLYSNFNLIPENKDKLILSKGHAVPILYAVFQELGLLSSEEMKTFREIDSRLQGHPVHRNLKYLHATTGSLGQGLSISIGHALAYKLKKQDNKVFCVLGDGEMQEGQVWEAFMLAPKYKLNNLYAFIDCNGSQNDGHVKDILDLNPLSQKIESFGWKVVHIDGHSIGAMDNFITNNESDLPTCVILDTVKGKGVSFMEGKKEWHTKVPNEEEYNQAIKELKY